MQDDEAYQDAADHGGQGEDGGAVADGTEVKKRVFFYSLDLQTRFALHLEVNIYVKLSGFFYQVRLLRFS